MSKTLQLKPRMSEKAYTTSQNGTYVFDVPCGASKQLVASSVEAQFNVKVTSVKTSNLKGKTKRTISQKGRRVNKGRNSNVKKAYVTLKKGESLPFFAAVDEAEAKQEEAQAKVAKATEKQSAKEVKAEAKTAHRGLHLPGRRSGTRGGDK